MKLDGPTLARRAPAQVQIAESAHTNVSGRWYESTPGMLRVTIWLVVLIPSRYSFIMLGGLGSPALLAGLVLIGLWMIGAATGAETGPRKCVPLRLVLAGVWTTWLLSYVVMHRQGVPWDESGNADRLLIGLASWTGIALAGGEGIKSRHDLLLVVRCLVDAVAAMAAIAVLQFRTGWAPIELLDKIPILQSNSGFGGVLSRSSFRRPAGTAGHPIEYGVIVSSALALSIHLVIHDRDRSRFHRWAAFSLIALGIPIAVSRSALLVTSVVIIVFWFGEKGRIRVRSLGVVVAMFAFVFATIPGLIGTLKGYVLAGNSDSSISTRTSDYAAAAPYLRDSPWLGRGPGTFLPRYFILDNQYLASLIEVGILGTVAIAILFLSTYWLGRGARHASSNESDRNLGQMLAAAGAAGAVAATTYDLLSFSMYSAMVFVYLGLAAALWQQTRHADEHSTPTLQEAQSTCR